MKKTRKKKMELPKELKITKNQAYLGDIIPTGDIFIKRENINNLVSILNGFKTISTFGQPQKMFFLGQYIEDEKEYFIDGRNDKEILLYYYLKKFKAKVVPIAGNILYDFNKNKIKNVPATLCIFINPEYRNYALLLKIMLEGERGIKNEIYNEYNVKNKEYFDLFRPYIEGIIYGYTKISTKKYLNKLVNENHELKDINFTSFYNKMKKDGDILLKKWLVSLDNKIYQRHIEDYKMPLIETEDEYKNELISYLKR